MKRGLLAVTPIGGNTELVRTRIEHFMSQRRYCDFEWRNLDAEQAELWGGYEDGCEHKTLNSRDVSALHALVRTTQGEVEDP